RLALGAVLELLAALGFALAADAAPGGTLVVRLAVGTVAFLAVGGRRRTAGDHDRGERDTQETAEEPGCSLHLNAPCRRRSCGCPIRSQGSICISCRSRASRCPSVGTCPTSSYRTRSPSSTCTRHRWRASRCLSAGTCRRSSCPTRNPSST